MGSTALSRSVFPLYGRDRSRFRHLADSFDDRDHLFSRVAGYGQLCGSRQCRRGSICRGHYVNGQFVTGPTPGRECSCPDRRTWTRQSGNVVVVHPYDWSAPRLFHHGQRSNDHQRALTSPSFLQSAPEHSLKICNAGSSFRKCVSRRHSESFCSSACSDGGETLELGLFLHATKLWLEGGNCHFSVQFSVFSALSKGTQEIGYRTEDRRANPGPARGSLDDHANPSAFFDLDGSERSLSGIDRFWFSFFPRVRDRHSAAATPNCATAVPAGRFLSRVAGHSWRMPGMVDRSSAQAADRVAHDDWGHDPNCVQR